MPNWVEQTLHVVGSESDVDRFIRTGFIRHKRGEIDDVLDFNRLCPLKTREPKRTYPHDSGVVLLHLRTRTQVTFEMITSWDYPAEFYARLPKHWPELSFICAVNEDMGQFGGIILVLDGECTDLVHPYVVDYSYRAHKREVGALQKRWHAFLTNGRPWRLIPHRPWTHPPMPYDAHFDDDFSFYFRTREELARFKARYRSMGIMRWTEGEWRRTRVLGT